MAARHGNRHFSQVCHLLALEPVQVRLYGRARILEILRREMQRIFQLNQARQKREQKQRSKF